MTAPTINSDNDFGSLPATPKPVRLYMDHAATAPILPQARAAVAEAMTRWANPSSPHAEGRAARALLEDCRARAKAALGWDGELIFTSGATEGVAIALGRCRGRRAVGCAVEHQAVLRWIAEDAVLPVDPSGRIDLAALDGRLGEGAPAIVALQQANNITGVIQPVAQALAIARAHGALLLVDAAQTAGKMALLVDADMIVVSAHKFGGPPGCGALLLRDLSWLEPTGGQERGYRAGTENLPAIAGMVAALEADHDWVENATRLRARIDAGIAAAGGEVVAAAVPRIPTVASYRMPGVSAQVQQMRFDMAGIALSATSACSTGAVAANPVLEAMGYAPAAAAEAIRIGLGRDIDEREADRVVAEWARIAASAGAR
jgi:cysteine desulfurase